MPAKPKKLSVPEAMRSRYDEITAITSAFCREKLNDEYAQLCREMTAALARKRPSPLVSGNANSWACGIAYTVGSVNFLFYKSQTPHMGAEELCSWFGFSKSTGGNRSNQIKKILKIDVFDTKWTLPSLIDQNPMAWMVSIDGFIMDARSLPRPLQEEAFRKGLIPYIPSEAKEEEFPSEKKVPQRSPKAPKVNTDLSGPVPYDFVIQVWQEMAEMPIEEAPGLMDQMAEEQPALLAYLLAGEAYGLSQGEVEELFYGGIVVWQIMKRWYPELTSVTIEQVEEAEDRNIKTLEFMEHDSEADFMSATMRMLDTYPEPEVLRSIVEAIIEEDEDVVELSDEVKGTFFLHLKTELDALILNFTNAF